MVKLLWAGLIGAILLAFVSVGTYILGEPGGVAEATLSEVNVIVGVDADPTGNDATTLGTIDRCISVNPTDPFYIDLFVDGVTNLNSWEGVFRSDGSILEVTSVDVQYFLATAPGSNVGLFSDGMPNSSGSFLVSAFDYGSAPESGSGVLARLELTPVGTGTSRLYFTLWWAFGMSGVILKDGAGAPIGDLDGDIYGYFDGLVFNAIVVVGGPCPTDADGDGFTNVEESVDGSDLLDVGSTPEMCDDADNDGDGLTDEWHDRVPVNGTPDCEDLDPLADADGDTVLNPTDTDDDNDGFSDVLEAYLATDSLADCAQNAYHNAWPLDINNDGDVSFSLDVLAFSGLIGKQYGDGDFRKRLDLNGDGDISFSLDVLQYNGHIGDFC